MPKPIISSAESSVDTTLIDNDSPGIALLLRATGYPSFNTLRLLTSRQGRVALDPERSDHVCSLADLDSLRGIGWETRVDWYVAQAPRWSRRLRGYEPDLERPERRPGQLFPAKVEPKVSFRLDRPEYVWCQSSDVEGARVRWSAGLSYFGNVHHPHYFDRENLRARSESGDSPYPATVSFDRPAVFATLVDLPVRKSVIPQSSLAAALCQ